MSTLAKSAAFSLSLLAGAAVAAHAQSSNVASLPPGATASPPAATAPVGPSAAYPGPNPGAGYYGGTVAQQQPVTPSPNYIGPNPGLGYYGTYTYKAPTGYDTDNTQHPYSQVGLGPRPN
jgi:hypothetical protein